MFRYFIIASILLAFVTKSNAQEDQNVRAVARIAVVDTSTDQVRKRGSGVAIGHDGYILTARYVVGDLNPARELIYVQFGSANAPRFRAELSECHGGDVDVCLIHVSGSDLASSNVNSFPPLGCRRLEVFEQIVTAGWPGVEGGELDRVQAQVSSQLSPGSLYQTTAFVLPGMSGGPVFDRSGHIVGLVKGSPETNTSPSRVLITPLFRAQALIRTTPQTCATSYDRDNPPTTPPPTTAPPAPTMSFVICEGQNEARCRPYSYDFFVGCYEVDNKISLLCEGRTAQRASVRPSEGGNRCGYSWVRVTC